QRLETILMFTKQGKFRRHAFEIRIDLGDGPGWYSWNEIAKDPHRRHALETYKIPTVEVDGSPSDVIDLFVRINSTGKPLTSGEKRHAKFFKSPFLKQAERLVARYRTYLVAQRILTD